MTKARDFNFTPDDVNPSTKTMVIVRHFEGVEEEWIKKKISILQ